MDPTAADMVANESVGGDDAADSKSMVFSYASPLIVKQAKLEAMQLKLQKRIKEISIKASEQQFEMAGFKLDAPSPSKTTQQAEQGSTEQFQTLIVPPEVNVHGGVKDSTSRFVSSGRSQGFQRVKRAAIVGGSTSNIQVSYHAVEHEEDAQEPPHPPHTAAKASIRPRKAGKEDQTHMSDPVRDQLRRSLKVSYVPVNVDSQATPHKALSSSAHMYEAVRSEVSKMLMLPSRGRGTASPGPSCSNAWSGFVHSSLTNMVVAIEEDLTGRKHKPPNVSEGPPAATDARPGQHRASPPRSVRGALSPKMQRVNSAPPGHLRASAPAPASPQFVATLDSKQRPASGSTPEGPASHSGQPRPASGSTPGGPASHSGQPRPASGSTPGGPASHSGQTRPASGSTPGGPASDSGQPRPASGSTGGGPASHSGQPLRPNSAPDCAAGQGERSQASRVLSMPLQRDATNAGVRRPATASAAAAPRGCAEGGAGRKGLSLPGTGELTAGLAQPSVWERLNRNIPATAVPTAKTMARGRGGRLFSAQRDSSSGSFSSPTPRVADIEAAAQAVKRDDSQHRVLLYRERQVYAANSGNQQAYGNGSKDGTGYIGCSRGGGGGGGSPHTMRPSSAPTLHASSMVSSMGTKSLEPQHLPPRPFSALPSTSCGAPLPRPTLAARAGLSTSIVRPHSALLCSATGVPSQRLRPPSAGMWAGRPVKTTLIAEDGKDEVFLANDWDKRTNDALTLLKVSSAGAVMPVS